MDRFDATPNVFLPELTRDEKREIWMKRNCETVEHLARIAGSTLSSLSRHLRNDTMPTAYHRKLIERGMPADTLPKPFDRRRGRKPRRAVCVDDLPVDNMTIA